jgi:nickel/cobalt exporter
MHLPPVALLLIGAGTVGFVHSLLPDHWVPLAVVARTQKWTMLRLARVSTLAAAGHVLTSVALGGVVALVGLQFQKQIETQQGHIVGGVLVITGIGFFVWGLAGNGHAHDHGPGHEKLHTDHERSSDASQSAASSRLEMDRGAHGHKHKRGVVVDPSGSHVHEHMHGGVRHTHRHDHEAFVQAKAALMVERSTRGTVLGHLAAIAVPFGVAASPDLTFLPLGIAAAGYGSGAVGAVLAVFAAVTLVTFVGLTLVATAAGYQMRGEWLEENANTITSLVLVAIGVVVYVGL